MTDILWVGYPRSYTNGRTRPVQGVCLHYTAGTEGPTSAEGGAAYDKRRTDGTSTHYFTDSAGPALQEVPDGDRAHTARTKGNNLFIHIEICGTIQTRSQWLDPVSLATLRTTAGLTAILLKRHKLAFRRLTTAEVKRAWDDRRITGICEHANCTLAFPEDGGTHLDVGAAFPWDVFLEMVRTELTGTGKDGAMAQMLIRDTGDGQLYLVDGMLRRKVTKAQIAPGAISNTGVHQSGLLGPLGNAGEVFDTSGDMDVWGAEYPPPVATVVGEVVVADESVQVIAKAVNDEAHRRSES